MMGNAFVLVISETRLDEAFSKEPFKIPRYTTAFRVADRYQKRGGITVFVREETIFH